MAVVRRFLIASSLTRLIRKERGSERVMEGHFPPQADRQSHVRIEKGQSYLVLTSLDGEVSAAQDWTDVPRSHAEALLDVCAGTVVYERSRLRLREHEALIDRFMTPGALDIVSVEFATAADADAFLPPVWFGSEVTGDESYAPRTIAMSGRPRAPDAPLSNAALETMLDLLESRSDEEHYSYERPAERQDDNVFERLRRLASVRPASPLPPAAPAAPAPTVAEATHEPEPVAPQAPPEAVARLRPRRPVLPIAPVVAPDMDGSSDERLAGVIQGLSEALSQASADKDERFGS